MVSRALLLAVLALALALAACGGDDDEEAAAPADTAAETAPATTEQTETETPPASTEPDPATGCRSVPQPAPRASGTEQAPAELLSEDKTYRVAVETSCGTFTITLDPKASPKAVASFVALAEKNFFDGTFFHRIVPGFVIQGGDPSGVGSGGPGYLTVDTPASDTTYTQGVVAMAKAPADPRGTAGSQFFIVTAPDAGLPPDYAVIGRVTGGEDVVARIAVLGDPTTEQPTQPVVVEDMVVSVR